MLFGRLPPAGGGFFAPMNFEFLKSHAEALLMQPGLCTRATWNGRTVTGTRSVMKRQDAATLAGETMKYDFSLLCPASQFPGARPDPLRDHLEIDGFKFLVLAVESDVAGNVRLHLGSQYG